MAQVHDAAAEKASVPMASEARAGRCGRGEGRFERLAASAAKIFFVRTRGSVRKKFFQGSPPEAAPAKVPPSNRHAPRPPIPSCSADILTFGRPVVNTTFQENVSDWETKNGLPPFPRSLHTPSPPSRSHPSLSLMLSTPSRSHPFFSIISYVFVSRLFPRSPSPSMSRRARGIPRARPL